MPTPRSLRGLDLNLLVVFDTVYATGNISHAATQLALTQPAVSNAIQRLRDHFDDPLFVRAGRGVAPTNRARQMIEPVRAALALIRGQVERGGEIDLTTYKRQFRIVLIDPLEPLMMPPLLRLIDEKAHGITIESRPPAQTRILEDVFAGTLDIAFYPFLASMPGLIVKPLCRAEPVVIARRGHPAIGDSIDTETLMRLGHVGLISELRAHAQIDRDITTVGGTRRIAYATNKVWSIPGIVATTDLIALLPRRFAEHVAPLYDLILREPPFTIGEQFYYAMWHEKNDDDPGHRWLREIMMAQAADPPVP